MGDGGPIRPGSTGRSTALPEARLMRLAVRAMVVLAAGTMATGFIHWRAGLLVAVLTAVTYPLLGRDASRLPAPYGRGRLLRSLERAGYRILPDGMSRHVAVGPGGVFLLETRTWRHAVARAPRGWLIGGVPAGRVVERLSRHAVRLEDALRLSALTTVPLVPVITVGGRLPEAVMRAGRGVIARPRGAVAYIRQRPAVLTAEQVEEIAARIDLSTRR
ncbi:hypothetical protein CDO52_25820 [Nocardiopsis gilva YIM 90087]|uniref:NERD domain-containing protein n=1 Tax=Nocardiopsis gilva YIM 90087 TaxID=1235441 RepID=A0A223SCF1_9ACTN|nr:hypothetical protein [Nocardiopsis gilva]ASU85765.1 hypothetical protein CDO52_25820 [Nocardiopsis gilva YIM 90087]